MEKVLASISDPQGSEYLTQGLAGANGSVDASNATSRKRFIIGPRRLTSSGEPSTVRCRLERRLAVTTSGTSRRSARLEKITPLAGPRKAYRTWNQRQPTRSANWRASRRKPDVLSQAR